MRTATAVIADIRNGTLVNELTQALSDALQSVHEVGKDATVTLKITIGPLTKMTMSEPAVGYSGEITTKLAKAPTEETIFYLDANGDPSRYPTRQAKLDISIAGSQQSQTAEGGK